jgi:hypothetical protein
MQSFAFITLSSGVSIEVPINWLPTKLAPTIWDLIKARGGPIPGVATGWTVELSAIEGAVYYSIHFGEMVVAAGAVVAHQEAADELWQMLEELHLKTYEVLSEEIGNAISDAWLGNPSQPIAAPWVGLVYQPDLLGCPEAAQWIPAFVTVLAQATLPVFLVA